ncbi:MAG TPA: hypothetical protein VGQ81_15500 [Acidobacteriota bacterium]|nr:hypothetical protein [Acidobacteriota bacterium]
MKRIKADAETRGVGRRGEGESGRAGEPGSGGAGEWGSGSGAGVANRQQQSRDRKGAARQSAEALSLESKAPIGETFRKVL